MNLDYIPSRSLYVLDTNSRQNNGPPYKLSASCAALKNPK